MTLTLLLAASVIPAGQSFPCTPTRVWDGDGPIWCAEGPRVELSGIAAREVDGSCKTGHPCPERDPIQSRDALVRLIGKPIGIAPEGHVLVRGQTMTCRSTGSAGGDRTAAFCVTPKGGDLSCAMVLSGNAEKWQRYWRGHRCR
jgi:endonuclease YncB( thermonuclease family)